MDIQDFRARGNSLLREGRRVHRVHGQYDAMRRFEARARQELLSTAALVQAGATEGRSPLEIDPPTAEKGTKNPNETVN